MLSSISNHAGYSERLGCPWEFLNTICSKENRRRGLVSSLVNGLHVDEENDYIRVGGRQASCTFIDTVLHGQRSRLNFAIKKRSRHLQHLIPVASIGALVALSGAATSTSAAGPHSAVVSTLTQLAVTAFAIASGACLSTRVESLWPRVEESPENLLVEGVDVTGYKIFNEPQVMKAIAFAKEAHSGQMRRTGEPYLTHCIHTAQILAAMVPEGGTRVVNTVVAGLLHDVVDDTSQGIEHVREVFGSDVAKLVAGVSKLSRINQLLRRHRRTSVHRSASENGGLTKEEVNALRVMILGMVNDPRVVLIKLADRLHNMRTMIQYIRDLWIRCWDWFHCPIDGITHILHPLWRHEGQFTNRELDEAWSTSVSRLYPDDVDMRLLEDQLLAFRNDHGVLVEIQLPVVPHSFSRYHGGRNRCHGSQLEMPCTLDSLVELQCWSLREKFEDLGTVSHKEKKQTYYSSAGAACILSLQSSSFGGRSFICSASSGGCGYY